MKNYSKLFKRVQAMILVVAMLLSVMNLGLFLNVSAVEAGQEDSKSDGQIVVENYDGLTATEEALLASGYLVGAVHTYKAPGAEDDLISVDIDTKKITAKVQGNWKPVSAQILVGNEVKEAVALTNGVGTYTYAGNAFSVKVNYEATIEIDKDLQSKLLNAPAWLKQGVLNMEAVAGQDGKLFILEQAMPKLVDLAQNGFETGTALGSISLSDTGVASVTTLNSQMTSNGGSLNLSTIIADYQADYSVKYLMENGNNVLAEIEVLLANLSAIQGALDLMTGFADTLVNNGLLDETTAGQIKTLNNAVTDLQNALLAIPTTWECLDNAPLLQDNGVNYADLDEKVNAINLAEAKGATLASGVKTTLLLDTTAVTYNMNAYNVNVKVVLKTADGIVGSTELKTAKIIDGKVLTFAKGTTAAEIAANAKDYVDATVAGMSAYGYVAEHFTVTNGALPAELTADTEYVITITPNNYTIDFAYDTDIVVPYGYKLLLAPHADGALSYDYKVNGVNHAQSVIVTILGTTTVSREEGKAYEFITLAEVVANNYFSGKTEAGILTSDAIVPGNVIISARHPGQGDGLVSISGDTLTALPFASDYKGLIWQPFSYTVVNGGSRTDTEFDGTATLPMFYDSVEVSYRLTLTGAFEASEVTSLLALPAQLSAEAKAQKNVLDRLAGYGELLGQLDRTKLGALSGVIDYSDIPNEHKAIFKDIVNNIINKCLDGNTLKLNKIIANYQDGGLEYYYKNSAFVLAEIGALSEYLDQMLADAGRQNSLGLLVSAAGYPEYSEKIKDMKDKMAAIKNDLSAPNAAIDTSSDALDTLLGLLTSGGMDDVPAYNGLYMFSNEKIELLSAGTISFKVSVNIAGQKPLTTDAIVFPKEHVLAAKDIEMIIALVQEKIDALGVSGKYYTDNYDEAIWDAFEGQKAETFASAYSYTWTPRTATVVVEGMANQTISILNNKIALNASPSDTIRYEYYLNGVLISKGGSYTFTEAQLNAAIDSGTVQITREDIDIGSETLINFVNNLNASVNNNVVTFALVQNGAAYSIVMKIDAAAAPNAMMSALQETVMAMTLSGYGYIGMNDRGMIYLNTENALEISLQTVIDAIMSSGFGTSTLIEAMNANGKINNMTLAGDVVSNIPMTALGGKLFGTTLQLGDVAANAGSYPFYITLGSASEELVQARNLFDEQLGSYMGFGCEDGKAHLTLTMPQKAYEAYLASLLVTDNISIEDINSVNAQIAVGFIKDFFNPVFDGEVTVQTLTNTMKLFGYNVDLTQYGKLFDTMADKYEGVEFEYDKTSGEITRKMSIQQLFDKLDIGDLAKMIKEYDTGIQITAKATLTNLGKDFEAMYFDLKASGVTNKLGLTTNLAAKLNNLSGVSVIVLMSDIEGNLTFNNTTVLNLNGFTVNGNIKSNGNLTIVDSSIGVKVGGVTGTVTGNVTITGGEYASDVTSFLKSGYAQNAGIVANEFYSFQKDLDGNLTIALDAGALTANVDTVPGVKTMLIDLAFDMLFNGYTTNKLEIAGSKVYDIKLTDFVGIYTGADRLSALVDQIGNMVSSKDLAALINTLVADLTDFGNLKNAILNDQPIIAYDMTTASWNVVLEHIAAGDYLTPSITSGEDQNRKLFVTITGSDADKKQLADMMGILDDTTDVNIKLDMDQTIDATNKDVTLDWSAMANVVVDLSGDHSYAVVFSILAADGISGPAQTKLINAIKTYYATGKITDLKNAFNALTTAQVVTAVKNLMPGDSFEDMVTGLGLDATVAEELTKLENVFDNYAKIIAAALRRTSFTGGSRTLGSFYKSNIGYGISRENMDKTFARELFKGYGIVLNTTITDLLISIELFSDEEAPEFVEGTGIPSVDADEDIADVKVDTTSKNIIIDANSDGIKAAVLESLLTFTALRYDTLTIEIEENANGLVYTGAKVVATASSSTGTAVIEYTIIILGDVNGDGKASALDATAISNTYLYDTPLTEAQKLAADMNGNGSVNAADATLIVNKFLYWDEYESSL